MLTYSLIFLAGFAGSFHCVGMCGGFTCALRGASLDKPRWWVRHVLYNCGRLATYAFIGAWVGALAQTFHGAHGARVPALDGPLGLAQRAFSVLAGLLMVMMALQLLGYLVRRPGAAGFSAAGLVTAVGSLVRAPGAAAPLALGVANGFLPCPLVYAFAALAAATLAPLPGILIMVAFGLGTFPAMLLMGGLGGILGAAWRRRGVRLAALFILLLGLITILRGLLPVAALHGHLTAHAL